MEGQCKPMAVFYLPAPQRAKEYQLFLRGDRKDCHTEVFSAVALIRLVMVKQRGAP